MDQVIAEKLLAWAERYNNPRYFEEDPVAFPRRFHHMMTTVEPTLGFEGGEWRPSLQDIEIAAVFSAHFAWGRRAMIVRDCSRLFDEMNYKERDVVVFIDMVEKLHELTGAPIPEPLSTLRDKQPRFSQVTDKENMQRVVLDALKIQ